MDQPKYVWNVGTVDGKVVVHVETETMEPFVARELAMQIEQAAEELDPLANV